MPAGMYLSFAVVCVPVLIFQPSSKCVVVSSVGTSFFIEYAYDKLAFSSVGVLRVESTCKLTEVSGLRFAPMKCV